MGASCDYNAAESSGALRRRVDAGPVGLCRTPRVTHPVQKGFEFQEKEIAFEDEMSESSGENLQQKQIFKVPLRLKEKLI